MKHATCKKCAKSVGTVNVIGNILMIMIKGYMGVAGRSKGLIADAIHSSADLLATIVMIIGLKVSEKNKDEEYPYGYGKVEYLAAVVIYLFLLVIGVYIIFNGIMCIIKSHHSEICLSAAWGAIFSIAINELMFRQSVCAGNQTNRPAMVAKAWESRSDVYSSIAVLIGILGSKMGFHFMDPLAAIIVGAIIFRMSFVMIKDAVVNLMDKAFDDEIVDDIRMFLGNVNGISEVKDVLAREMGKYLEFEIQLFVPPDISVRAGEKIKKEVKQAVIDLLDRKSNITVRLFAS